ncbi:hypothetical protein AB0K60_34475 [Thermopolyspora sp. NPDC052614]|uniref:hypothetical protein n=1 Tax=Thermopolyspora sp. NPDC052614 TaxID=3155682 RepID=UPI00344AFAB5
MGGDGLRSFKPDQLERLAGLMDNLDTAAGEAFTRASTLQVSGLMSPLREMPRWAGDNGRDLRRRAALGRLQTGDPFAGLAWAGFSPLEIAAYGDKLDPASLIYINTVADWADRVGNGEYARKPGESLDSYLKRLEAAALAKAIPALKPHEATVANVLRIIGDVRGVSVAAPVVTAQSIALGRLLMNNKAWQPLISKITGGRWTFQTRSAMAPGTTLGNLTRNLFMRSSLYRDYVAMLPEYAEMDQIGRVVNGGRALAGLRVNQFIDLTFGNNKLAQLLGGTTHSGQAVKLSGQANLLKVWAATADPKKMEAAAAILKVEPAALSRVGAVARTAGGLRVLGVAGGAASTVYSAANVISQGNPVEAFKRSGAGYVADVAEVGFNASLTAAMIAPNPVTIGATVVFGAVYVGAKVVEHWDDIKSGAGKAVKAAGDGLKKAGNFVKSLNPFG